MNIKRKLQISVWMVFYLLAPAHGETYFPDIPGYKTLICDLHTHTVFSDGLVWPTVRIDEAKREGLDAIAISDHIEYQPHKDDIPTNHNRSYEIAKEAADKQDILLIKAAEITRDTPPGHYNALFLSDINLLVTNDFLDVIEKANKQHAFVFWNHHSWKGDEKGQWTALQTTMREKKWLHGMEVANGGTYYPQAHAWCLEKNLTMVGNSDIHHPSIDYQYTANKHRTLTLVFAQERTVESIQQALIAGRTVVWHENRLIGREEYLKPLFEQCLKIALPHYTDQHVVFEVTNNALIDFKLERNEGSHQEIISVPARSTVTLKEKYLKNQSEIKLSYHVGNLLIGTDAGLPVEIAFDSFKK